MPAPASPWFRLLLSSALGFWFLPLASCRGNSCLGFCPIGDCSVSSCFLPASSSSFLHASLPLRRRSPPFLRRPPAPRRWPLPIGSACSPGCALVAVVAGEGRRLRWFGGCRSVGASSGGRPVAFFLPGTPRPYRVRLVPWVRRPRPPCRGGAPPAVVRGVSGCCGFYRGRPAAFLLPGTPRAVGFSCSAIALSGCSKGLHPSSCDVFPAQVRVLFVCPAIACSYGWSTRFPSIALAAPRFGCTNRFLLRIGPPCIAMLSLQSCSPLSLCSCSWLLPRLLRLLQVLWFCDLVTSLLLPVRYVRLPCAAMVSLPFHSVR